MCVSDLGLPLFWHSGKGSPDGRVTVSPTLIETRGQRVAVLKGDTSVVVFVDVVVFVVV